MEGAAASLQLPSGKTIAEYMAGLDEDVKKAKTCDKKCKRFFPYFNRKKHTECKGKFECELCGYPFAKKYNRSYHLQHQVCTNQFHCKDCGTDFLTIKERESHRDNCEKKETQLSRESEKRRAHMIHTEEPLKLPSGQTIAEYIAGLDEDVRIDKTCNAECTRSYPYFNRNHHKCNRENECELCGFPFAKKYSRSVHLQNQVCTNQFHCKDCGTDFLTTEERERHREYCEAKEAESDVRLKLPSGQTIAEYMAGLDEDVRIDKTCDKECKWSYPYFNRKKHTECNRKNECKWCGVSFSKKSYLNVHYKKKLCTPSDNPEDGSVIYGKRFVTCKSCTREYIPHQKHKHRCYAAIVCERCGRDFNRMDVYEKHTEKGDCVKYADVYLKLPSGQTIAEYIAGLDEDVRQDKTCDRECKKSFPYFIPEYHQCNTKFECDFCGFSFSNLGNRYWHLRNQVCEKQFHCQNCGEIFLTIEDRECHRHGCKEKEADLSTSDKQPNKDVTIGGSSRRKICYKMPSGQTIAEYMAGLDEDVRIDKTCDKECKRSYPYFLRFQHKCNSEFECELCGSPFTFQTSKCLHKRNNICCKQFNCQNCGENFLTIEDRQRHIDDCEEKEADPNTSDKQLNRKVAKRRAVTRRRYWYKLPSGQTITEYMAHLDEDVKKDKTCDGKCKKPFPYFWKAEHDCGGKYECKLCGASFNHRNSRNWHLRSQVCTNQFNCQICGENFLTIEERERHRDDCEQKDTSCPKCFKSFTNFKPVLHVCHAKIMCKLCGQRFRYRTNLRRHKHRKSCSSKFPCKYCNRVFASVLSSRAHQITCQSKPPVKVLTCRKCKRQYHNDVPHDCNFKITCNDCGRYFYSHLRRFVHIMLGSCKSIKTCCGCGKSFDVSCLFSGHLKTCDLWKNNFGAKLEGWRAKIEECEDKVNKCPVCWETFPDLDLLERHMENGNCSDKDRTQDKLVCVKCNQKKIKQRMHFCKGFYCRLCDKVFTSKSELNCHLTLQRCLAIQKCYHCGKSFKDGGFEEHFLLNLCRKGKKKSAKPTRPNKPVITPPGFCSFCFKRIRKDEAVEHLKKCEQLPTKERPSCPFCLCQFGSPLDVFMHTANLKDTTCFRRGFPCGHCMFITTSKKVAVAHAKSKHNLSIPFTDVKIETGFSCFVCNEHFKEKEVHARFHTLTCSETYGMNPLRVNLKRCNEETIVSEVPAKLPRLEAVVKVEPETEEEYVPRLVLVVP